MIDIGGSISGAVDAAGDIVDAITGEGEEGPKVTRSCLIEEISKHLNPDKQVFPCSIKGDEAIKKAFSEFVPPEIFAATAALGITDLDLGSAVNMVSNVASMMDEADPEEAKELRPICLETLIKGESACQCPNPGSVSATIRPESEEVEAILENDEIPFLVLSGIDAAFLQFIVNLSGIFQKEGRITGSKEEVRIKAIYLYLKSREIMGYGGDEDTPGTTGLFGLGSTERNDDHYHWQNMRAIEKKMDDRSISSTELDLDDKLSWSGFENMVSRCAGALSDIDINDPIITGSLNAFFDNINEIIGKIDLPFDLPISDIKGMVNISFEGEGNFDLSQILEQMGITPTAYDGAKTYFLEGLISAAFSPFNVLGWAVKVINWLLALFQAMFTDKDFDTTFKTFPEPDLGKNDFGIFFSCIILDIVFNWLLRLAGDLQFSDMNFSRIGDNFRNFFSAWAPPDDETWTNLKEEKGLLGAFLLYNTEIEGSSGGERIPQNATFMIFDFFMFMFMGYYCMRYLSTSTSVGGNFAGVGRTLLVCLLLTIVHNYIITGVYREVSFNFLWISMFGAIFGIFMFEMFKAIGHWSHLFTIALIGCVIGFAWSALDWRDIVYTALMGFMISAYMASNIGEFGMLTLEDWNETDEAELSREENYTGIKFQLDGAEDVHGIELMLERTSTGRPNFDTQSFFIVNGYLPKNEESGEELQVPAGKYKVYFTKRKKDGSLINLTDTDPPDVIKVHSEANTTLVTEIDIPATEAESETPFKIFLQWENYVRIKAYNLGGLPDYAGICVQNETWSPVATTHLEIDVPNATPGTRNHIIEEHGAHAYVVPGYTEGGNTFGVEKGTDADGKLHTYKIWGAIDLDDTGDPTVNDWLRTHVVITYRDISFDPDEDTAMFQEPVMMTKLRHKYDKSKVDASPPSKAFLTGDVPIVIQPRGNCGAFSSSVCFNFWQPYKYNPQTSPDGVLDDEQSRTNSGGMFVDNHMPELFIAAGARYPEAIEEYHLDNDYQSKVIIGDRFEKSEALNSLKPYIAANIPVICLVQEYIGEISSMHYKTLVGYDDDREVKGLLVTLDDTVTISKLEDGHLSSEKGNFNIAVGTSATVKVVNEVDWRVRIIVPNLDMEGNSEDTFQVKNDEIEFVDPAETRLAVGRNVKIKQMDSDGLGGSDYDLEIGLEGEVTNLTPLTIKLDDEVYHKEGTQTKYIQAKDTEIAKVGGGTIAVGDKVEVTALVVNSLSNYPYLVEIGEQGDVLAINGDTYDIKLDNEVDRCFNAHPDELKKDGNGIVYNHTGVFYFNNTGAQQENNGHTPDERKYKEYSDEDPWANVPIGNDMDPQDTFWEKWVRGGLMHGFGGQLQDCTFIPTPVNPP